jgi:cytochrome b561
MTGTGRRDITPNGGRHSLVKEVAVRLDVPERYTRPAITLHWLIAVLIGLNLLIGLSFESIPKESLRPYIDIHKSFGISVLGLVVLRLLWRATHTPPPMPAAYPAWQQKAAHWVHWGLYGMMFIVPLTGWLHDSAWKLASTHAMKLFWVIPWFRFGFVEHMEPAAKEQFHTVMGEVHGSLAYLLLLLFLVHVAAALKHQFLDRTPELQRMWPQRRTKDQ